MTVRTYLCRIVGTGTFGDSCRPETADDLVPGESWSMLDLRTFEDQVGRVGFGLVTLEATDAAHAVYQAKFGLLEIVETTGKPEIVAKIGPEAADEAFINPKDFCLRVHVRRRARFRAERRMAR